MKKVKSIRYGCALVCSCFAIVFLFSVVQAADVTDSIQINESGAFYNRRTGNYSYNVVLENISSNGFQSPITAVITNLSSADVTVSNADGTDSSGNPYFDYSGLLGDDNILNAGELSGAKKWIFHNPTRVRFTYDVQIMAGAATTDDVLPSISITNPVDNSVTTTTNPYFTIEFTDDDSGINLSSLAIQINGTDSTSLFGVTNTRATYQATSPLLSGSNVITTSISDNAGNTSTVVSDFTVASSTEPIRYIFSVANNDWIFASPGDGTCAEYLSKEDLGLSDPSDVVSVSRARPGDNLFFTLSGQGGILQSPCDGSNSLYFNNTQLGLGDNDQICAEHTGLDGSASFSVEGEPDIYQSLGANAKWFYMQKAQLGIADSVQVSCLHIGYDNKIYFCRSDQSGIFQSDGDSTNSQILTAADLGVSSSIIDGFAILPENILPTISITNPSNGSTINTMTPNISISFSDPDSGVNTGSFTAEINGTDSTSIFNVTSTGATYQVTTPLPIGNNVITASISDNVGNQAGATSNFVVEVFQAALTATPKKGGIPLEVQFSAAIVGGVSPYSYAWDINGDGAVDDTRESFSYIYQTRGIYAVALTVTDTTGETVSASETIYALSAPAVIASASPTSGGAPLDVAFSATVNDPDGSIVLYEWDFDGDGTYDYSDSSTASTTFTYGTAGLYQATIRVTDNDDLTETDTITIAAGSSPSASATAAPMTGPAPLEVSFSGTGTDPDGTISLYEWDFDGDGTYDWSSTTTGDVTHTYSSAGIFNATFRVTDNDGLIDTDSVLISVSGPPISKPGAFPTSGEAPLTVTFFSNGEDLDGSPEYYDWDFDGDGNNDSHLIASMNTTYTYNQAGTYNATLMVTDNEGLTGTASVTITVTGTTSPGYPTAIAMANPSNGGAPLQVALSGKATDEDGTITKLEWDFEGDGVFDFEDTVIPGSTLGDILDIGSYSSPELVDIDNDGDLDLFIGEYYGQIYFYRNDGDSNAPVWTSVGYVTDSADSTIDAGSYSSPDFVDTDNDGDLDLFIGEYRGQIYFYRNDGDSSAPVWTSVGYVTDSADSTIDAGSHSSPDFVDIDGDGDLDLFIGESYGRIYFYRNDGDNSAPVWTSVGYVTDSAGSTIDAGSHSSPDFVDIDGDGDFDLLIGESGGRIYFYRNDGDNSGPVWTSVGYVTDSAGSTIDAGSYNSPDFVDIDGDGDFDLFMGESGGRIRVYNNDGDTKTPTWRLIVQYLGYIGADGYSAPSVVDIDADGDFDMFIGDNNGFVYYYRNDGSNSAPFFNPAGSITDSSGGTIDAGSYSSPDFADIDGDDDLDLFIGESGGQIYFYRNEGNSSAPIWTSVGYVTDSAGSTIDAGSYSSPELVDIDNDGDLDLFIGKSGGRIYFYRNDGDSNAPVWTSVDYVTDSAGSTIDAGSYSTPDLVDIDSDGDFDLFIGESGGRIYFYMNEGSVNSPVWSSEGYFTDSSNTTIDVGSYSTPDFVDIDGDGDFDLITGNRSGYIYLYPTVGFVKHNYTIPGTYEATLQVTDNSGQTATDSITIRVFETGTPTATADANPTTGDVPLDVSFTGTGNDADGTILLYEWDFDGDGIYDWSNGSSGNTSYTYNHVGSYVATLRVTDNDGKTSTDSITISTSLGLSASGTAMFDPVSGGTGSITSNITGDSTVTVEIIDQSGNVVQTLANNEPRTTGTYTDTWDGKDNTGKIVRDGVYYFLIEHTENGETQIFDLRETAQYREVTPSRSWPSTFNPYEEDYVHVTYSISYPAEVSMYFWKRDDSHPGSSIAPVRTMFLRQPKDTGSHTEIWDGVDDEGAVVGPWSGGYCITLWTYELPSNAIIITGNTPVITDVEAKPNYFCPAYNAYGSTEPKHTVVSFNLSEAANVEVKIKNSGGVVVKFFNKTGLPVGANAIIWDGKDFDGNLVKEGSYSISLTAIDNDGNRSLPRYAAIIIHY